MFDLKCKQTNCTYNKNCNCTSKKIDVTKETDCKTYKKSNEAEVGEIEKIGQPPIRKNIEVSCSAQCLFNRERLCIANGITVQTENLCPKCCTFEPK